MALDVGKDDTLYGDVTQLKAIGAKAPAGVEEMLGYHAGRLARGYWICLLRGTLTPGDFEFGGNTLRSGGKLGAPEKTQSAEKGRVRVHDDLLDRVGPLEYRRLQQQALGNVAPTGDGRLVKIVPVTGHMRYGSPAAQYPMGGGALQWTILKPGKLFYVAAFVSALAEARTPHFTVSVAANAAYDDRARLRRFLSDVPTP